jgi:ribosomal protein S18 acetylase RimI-like enzyme
VTIRRAFLDDIGGLLAVHGDAFHDKFVAAFGSRSYDRGVALMHDIWRRQGPAGMAGIWVAMADGEIVGTIAVRSRLASRLLPPIPVEWLFIRTLGLFRGLYAIFALSLVDYHVGADEAYISDVAVRSSHRRRGIATLLLEHAIAEAQRQRLRSVCLFVKANNTSALRLYQQHGFVQVGVRRSLFGWILVRNSTWYLLRRTVTAPVPSQIVE